MSKNKVIIVGLVAAALVATIIVNKQKPAETPVNNESQSLSVEATKISSEFKENKATALESYKNKIVEINGTVKQVEKATGSEHIIFVSSADAFEVKAKFSDKAEIEKLASLNAGQNTVVKCVGDSADSSFAEFKDCTLSNNSTVAVEPAKPEAASENQAQPTAEQPAVAPAEANAPTEQPATAPANSNPAANN